MKYIVLEASSNSQLAMLVNQYLSNGWTLQGGVAVATEHGNWSYCQAMVITD